MSHVPVLHRFLGGEDHASYNHYGYLCSSSGYFCSRAERWANCYVCWGPRFRRSTDLRCCI